MQNVNVKRVRNLRNINFPTFLSPWGGSESQEFARFFVSQPSSVHLFVVARSSRCICEFVLIQGNSPLFQVQCLDRWKFTVAHSSSTDSRLSRPSHSIPTAPFWLLEERMETLSFGTQAQARIYGLWTEYVGHI